VFPSPGFLQHLCPQDMGLPYPHQTHAEEAVPSLLLAPSPPTVGSRPIFHQLKVLARGTMPCLDLVGAGGKPLGDPSHRTVRPHSSALRTPPPPRSPGPQPSVTQRFKSAGVWIIRRELGPFVDLLVRRDSLVYRTPPERGGYIRVAFPVQCHVPSRLEHVLPAGGLSSRRPYVEGGLRIRHDVTRSGVSCLRGRDSSTLARAAHSAS